MHHSHRPYEDQITEYTPFLQIHYKFLSLLLSLTLCLLFSKSSLLIKDHCIDGQRTNVAYRSSIASYPGTIESEINERENLLLKQENKPYTTL